MAYTKTSWLDRIVQFPMRYKDQNNNQLILSADPGTVTQAGTPVNATRLNKIEQGVADAHALNVDNVTVSDTSAPTSDTTAPKTLFNWFAYMIKSITGKSNWRTTPRTTLENAVKLNGDTMTGTLSVPTIAGVTSTGVVTNLNADRVDGFHIRKNNGVYQASADGSTWENMGNLIDVTSLIPFSADVITTGNNAFQTIFSVTGKGFIESFYGFAPATGAPLTLRLTVDGVVKILVTNATGDTLLGLINKADYQASTSAGAVRSVNGLSGSTRTTGGVSTYPDISGSDRILVMGEAKIYFQTSLLLEGKRNTAETYAVHYAGGYI